METPSPSVSPSPSSTVGVPTGTELTEVGADLVVVGPHRGGPAGARGHAGQRRGPGDRQAAEPVERALLQVGRQPGVVGVRVGEHHGLDVCWERGRGGSEPVPGRVVAHDLQIAREDPEFVVEDELAQQRCGQTDTGGPWMQPRTAGPILVSDQIELVSQHAATP